MRTLIKHTLMLLLCITVLCCILPCTVSATEEITGNCGENATYSFDGAGTLTISGTGTISSHPYDDQYVRKEDITTVVIQPGITVIGESVFVNCSNLTSVTIADTVTVIGKNAFCNCVELTNITIPDSVTDIGEDAFNECKKLSSVTIGNSVTSIGASAFYECTALTDVNIPSSVTTIGNRAFGQCSSLVSITIPNSVTNLGCATFYRCTSLTSITLGNGITGIGESLFEFCTNLESITIPESVTSIGPMAFFNCQGLTSVSIPNDLESIGEGAFSVCTGLTRVVIPDSVTEIGNGAFSGCSGLTAINIPNGISKIGMEVLYGCKSLTSITIPASVTSIGDGALCRCESLDSIYFMGDAPKALANEFDGLTTTAYYPCENNTWTEAAMQNYGGTITWKAINYQLDVPTINATSRAADGKPVIKWNAVDGAAKYQIYVSTDKASWKRISTTASTRFTNISAVTGKYYYYYVVAIDPNGHQSKSSNIAGRTCDLPQPVVTVTNVASSGKIKLTWDAIDGAVKYKIYRATSKNGTYSLLTTNTGTSCTNISAEAGKTYYYKVRAIHSKSAANSADSAVVYRTCDLPRPVVEVELNSSGKPVLSWEAVDGAVKYRVYSATSKNGEYTRLITTAKTSITNTSAKAGTTYYYKVVAVAPESAANSAHSVIVSIKAK